MAARKPAGTAAAGTAPAWADTAADRGSAQGLVVVGIAHHADVGKRIADFSTLIEGQTTVNMVGNIRETHCLLERTALRIGAIKHGDFLIGQGFGRTQITNDRGHLQPFFAVALTGKNRNRVAHLATAGPTILGTAVLTMFWHPVKM